MCTAGMSSLAALLSPKPRTGGAWPRYVCTGGDAPGDRESRQSGLEPSRGRGNNQSLSSSPHGCSLPGRGDLPGHRWVSGDSPGRVAQPQDSGDVGHPCPGAGCSRCAQALGENARCRLPPRTTRLSLCPAGHQSWCGMVGTWLAAAAFPPQGCTAPVPRATLGKDKGWDCTAARSALRDSLAYPKIF